MIIIGRDVCHDEILFKSSWQDGVAAVIDVLANDIDTTRCSAVESRTNTVKFSEAPRKILISRLVLLSDGIVVILVNIRQLSHDWYRADIGSRALSLSSSCGLLSFRFNHI